MAGDSESTGRGGGSTSRGRGRGRRGRYGRGRGRGRGRGTAIASVSKNASKTELFIKEIPDPLLSPDALRQRFSQFGNIESIVLKSDRRFAFVAFTSPVRAVSGR